MFAKISTKSCSPSLQHILMLQSQQKKIPFYGHEKTPFSPKLLQKITRDGRPGGVAFSAQCTFKQFKTSHFCTLQSLD
jgi:hypothetical protein